MPRKPTIINDDRVNSGESRTSLFHPFVVTSHLLVAYAEMGADSDREAEAEEWLGANSVDMLLDKT